MSTEPTEAQIIEEFLSNVREFLQDWMEANDMNATGKTSAGIYLEKPTDFGGKVWGPGHVEFTFKGRGPGKMPPLANIIEWCVARRIPRSRAWVIADKIKREGTKLFQKNLGDQNAIALATSPDKVEEFVSTLKTTIVAKTRSDIRNIIKK